MKTVKERVAQEFHKSQMSISLFQSVYDPSELIFEGKDILENKGRYYFA